MDWIFYGTKIYWMKLWKLSTKYNKNQKRFFFKVSENQNKCYFESRIDNSTFLESEIKVISRESEIDLWNEIFLKIGAKIHDKLFFKEDKSWDKCFFKNKTINRIDLSQRQREGADISPCVKFRNFAGIRIELENRESRTGEVPGRKSGQTGC